MTVQDIVKIEQKIGYSFNSKKLLEQAFTHSSYANVKNVSDNERMEFLGDVILSNIVSEEIYKRFAECGAGDLSKMRAAIVSAKSLRPVVMDLGILPYLLVANGSGNIKQISSKIAANLYEALLCAIYFDGGITAATKFVLKTLSQSITNAMTLIEYDYKSLLSEYAQQRKMRVEFRLISRSGPDNRPMFCCALYIDEQEVSQGLGTNKKGAEQSAAKKIVEEWRIN